MRVRRVPRHGRSRPVAWRVRRLVRRVRCVPRRRWRGRVRCALRGSRGARLELYRVRRGRWRWRHALRRVRRRCAGRPTVRWRVRYRTRRASPTWPCPQAPSARPCRCPPGLCRALPNHAPHPRPSATASPSGTPSAPRHRPPPGRSTSSPCAAPTSTTTASSTATGAAAPHPQPARHPPRARRRRARDPPTRSCCRGRRRRRWSLRLRSQLRVRREGVRAGVRPACREWAASARAVDRTGLAGRGVSRAARRPRRPERPQCPAREPPRVGFWPGLAIGSTWTLT